MAITPMTATGTRELKVSVPLPAGSVEVDAVLHEPPRSVATVIVAHGAGTGMDHPFLIGFANELARSGLRAVRFNFAYSQLGRRMPGPAAHAIAAWTAVADLVDDGTPWFAAGRSYGGRMGSMAAAEGVMAPTGLVYLGYPLHPPGKPDAPRVAHLPQITAPQLFLSGTRDPFVDPHEQLEQAVASCRDATLQWVDAAGHGFEVAGHKRPAADIGVDIAARVVPWMRDRLA